MDTYTSSHFFHIKRIQIFNSLRHHLRKIKVRSSRDDTVSPSNAPQTAPRSSSPSDLDAYWPGQRRPHPVTTRLPSSGTVQDLVSWFDQKPAAQTGGKCFTRRPTVAPPGGAAIQDHSAALKGEACLKHFEHLIKVLVVEPMYVHEGLSSCIMLSIHVCNSPQGGPCNT